MQALKPGWKWVKFGEVVRLCRETCKDPAAEGIERYIGLEHIEPGDLRVRTWGDVADGTTFTNRVRPGQVLFGKRRAYQRKVAVADFDAVCSGDIYVFESVNPTRLLPELLPFLCQTDAFFDHAVGTSAGSLSPRTNWSSLAEYEFALPPLEEQRRVVALLSSFATVVNELRAARETAQTVRDRLRLDAGMAAGSTTKLANLLSFLTSGSRGWSMYYSEDGEAFLRIGNLNSPTIELNLSDMQRVRAPNDAEAERTRVQANDVLLGITGEAGVGLVAVARSSPESRFISQHIAMIRLDPSKASADFVAHVLAGGFGQRQIWRHNQPGAKAGMTLDAVRELRLPDLPLASQRVWVERIAAAESAMIATQDRLTSTFLRSCELRESILTPGIASV